MNENYQIAIDGPTASGKGTVSRLLAQKLGLISLCTGAIYRAITIHFYDNGLSHMDAEVVDEVLKNIQLDIKCIDNETVVFLDGVDVTARLHNVEISTRVASIARVPEIRTKVREIQKATAEGQTLICEGRDITSVVFPNARFKFYLTAGLNERARRRYLQEVEKNQDVTFEQVKKGIHDRDHADMTRPNSPLKCVKGAIKLDATKKSAEQVATEMEKIIRKQIAADEKKTEIKLAKEKYAREHDLDPPRYATFLRRFCKIVVTIPYRLIFWTRVINKKELKQHKGSGVIFAINHRSLSDVPTIFINFPTHKLHFIGKESLFKPRSILNWILRGLNGYPLRAGKNDLAIIRHSLEVLKKNDTLVIFPEGTRSFDTSSLAVQSGTAVIALKSGAPIIPIVTKRKPRPFTMNAFKIGKTIWTKDFTDKNELSAKLRDEMMELLDGFEYKPKPKKWDVEPVYNARAICFVGDKLLAIERHRPHDDFYVFPGGHLDEGETPAEAVVRELKEEANITTTPVRVLYKKKRENRMQAFYLCKYESGEVSKTDADEYQDGYSDTLGRDGKPNGTHTPVLLDIADLPNLNLRPMEIKKQLLKDIKKYRTRLTRPTKYLK